jgi:hypothetical protein
MFGGVAGDKLFFYRSDVFGYETIISFVQREARNAQSLFIPKKQEFE